MGDYTLTFDMGWKDGTQSKNKSRNLTWHLEISEALMVDLENFMVTEDAHAHNMHVEKKKLKTVKRENQLSNSWIAKKTQNQNPTKKPKTKQNPPFNSVKIIYSDLWTG